MLKITVSHESARVPVAVMELEGELDAATYMEVIANARQLTEDGTHDILLDLGSLTYMGSSGLFVIHSVSMLLRGEEPPDPEDGWGAFRAMDRPHTDAVEHLKLLNAQPQVDRVLDRSGMKRFFECHTDRSSALESF